MRGCIYCIFLWFCSLELRSWLQYHHLIFGKFCPWTGLASRLTVKMPDSVILFLFLFQIRPRLTGRARMKCCGGATVTKRWISNFDKIHLNAFVKRAALWMRKSCIMHSKECVTWIKEWRRPISGGDKQFSLVSWQKILEEQRRLKREQEEADTASRRHTGIVPTHHQFITNERFGDLLNITDNTEKRKSGVEVQCWAVSYPSVSRKKDGRCFVSLFVSQAVGGGWWACQWDFCRHRWLSPLGQKFRGWEQW